MALPAKIRGEIVKCAKVFLYFCRRWLWILTKEDGLLRFPLKDKQIEAIQLVLKHRWVYILKGRQIGITTGMAALFFWMALFLKKRVLVIAHNRETAEEIFQIYDRFYFHLPSFLKRKLVRSNLREIRFDHGGRIRVTTAGSDMGAGTTWNVIHGTEFARWKKMDQAIEALLQTLTPGGYFVAETTSIGQNRAYGIWTDDNGYFKHFISWLDEPTYVRSEPPPRPVGVDEAILPKGRAFFDHELRFIKRHKLPLHRAYWYAHTLRTKCGNNQNTFNQAYPTTEELAWITAGDLFFTREVIASARDHGRHGLEVFEEPKKFAVYSAGVDTGSGSRLDRSTVVIGDITDPKRIRTVATLRVEGMAPLEFAREAYALVSRYRALAVIEVTGGYGLAVQGWFEEQQYDHLWCRSEMEKRGQKLVEKLGWDTNGKTRPVMLARLNDLFTQGFYDPVDPRLKWEMRTFEYREDGKPEASDGHYDDMVTAGAQMVMGLDQVEAVIAEVQGQPGGVPSSFQEMLWYETRTGKDWDFAADKPRPGPVTGLPQ